MQALTNSELSPEAKAQMQFVLLDLQEWAADQKRIPSMVVLAKQLEVYWQTGEWLGDFQIKPLPPGSPI